MTTEEAMKLAVEIQGFGYNIPKPVTREWVEAAVDKGMIPKADLVNGAYYVGCCRNAYIARWNGEKFHYLRVKFADPFVEAIDYPCPENDTGFDLFVPTMRLVLEARCT